jgi:hypothetical protein
MVRSGLSVAMVLLAAAVVQAKVELRNVQAAYGIFGPERKSLDMYPGDEVLFRFTVVGVRLGDDRRTDAVMAVKLTTADGDVLLAQDTPLRVLLGLGGDSFPAQARINLGERTPAGDYTLTVTVTDKLAGEKTSFQRKLTCKPIEFALVAPEFFLDPDGKIPAPAGGLVGQALFFRLRAVGLDRSQDKIDSTMEMHVLDAQGKDVLPKPVTVEVKNDDAEVVRKASIITYRGSLFLNRSGEFTLQIVVTDRIARKTARFETALRVTPP